MNTARLLLLPAALALCPVPARSGTERVLEIRAGGHERQGGIVSFEAPESWRGLAGELAEDHSPVQVDAEGNGSLILRTPLPKDASRTFTFVPGSPAGGVKLTREGPVLRAEALPRDGGASARPAPMFTYQMEPGPLPEGTPARFAHGAHLHPLFTPSGRLVTADHPPDHPHQRGIWFAWTRTEFEGREVDFWNMGNEKHGGITGEVRFDKLDKTWSGPVHGGFTSTHRWIDHTSGSPKDMLRETWELKACQVDDGAPRFVLDLTSTQLCATDLAVKLPKYHYGGLGVRGNALWDPPPNVAMLTSNGDDRTKGDGSKARWVWLGGEVDGKTCGILVLIHPANFRFPQPLRLNPKNPQLCVAPSAEGDWSIEPGRPYVSRYRLVVRDGAPDAAAFEREWADYAEPARATAR